MIDTSTKNVRAVIFGLRQFNREHEWVVGNAADLIDALAAENEKLRGVLEWYAEQTRLCRLIHSGGDPGRQALSDDGGKRAQAALSTTKED